SPLLEASIDGAHGVLLSIQGGSDLGLFEIHEAARLVQEAAHPEANIIFGAVIDDALGDEVRVTVIAAGFDTAATQAGGAGEKTAAAPRIPEVPRTNESAPAQQAGSASPSPGQAGHAQPGTAQQPPAQQPPAGQPPAGQPAAEPAARETNTAPT